MNFTGYTTLILKLIGIIFVISSFLDYVTLAIPLNWQQPQWQIGFVTSVVDRGIVPMVGMGFIFVGYWIDQTSGFKGSKLDLRLPTYVVASVLGLIFLLMVPLHLSNLNRAQQTALEQIEQGAGQGEQQITAFLNQVDQLSKNPTRLNQEIQQRTQVIEAGQLQGRQLNAQQVDTLRQQRDQLQQLKDLSQNPQEYKKRVDQIKNTLQTQLADRKRQAEGQARLQAIKQGVRIGVSSLMLAIGYSTIGWFGLKGQGSQKTAKAR
ncbi:MAG: HpsJ family protein [Microcystaceae cyanobacterium]